MLSKTEVMCAYMMYDGFDGYIWDNWFHYRLKKAGHEYKPDRTKEDRELWQKVLDEMPNMYIIDINVGEQKVTIEYPEGVDEFPLSDFCDEDEDEPKVEMLTRGHYWDGPITGTCLFNGVKADYEMIEEGDLDRNRKYAAYKRRPLGIGKGKKLGEFYWFHFKHYQEPR